MTERKVRSRSLRKRTASETMNQNTMLRFAALAVSVVLLTAVLTACGGSGSRNTTTTGTTSASSTTTSTSATSDTHTGNSHGTETGTGTGTGINGGVDGILNGNGSGTATGEGNIIGEMLPDMNAPDLSNATVRFNGADYRVSEEEQLRRDEIGEELFTVQQTTDKPENDGDAMGLPAGIKVWSIKDNTDYSAIAVEIDGMFYRANRQAD